MDTVANKANRTVGEYVADDYRVAEIFERYGIDFCCGGQKPLAEVCREKGLDYTEIQQEVHDVSSQAATPGEDYANWSLAFLIDYIVNTHHAYLYQNNNKIKLYIDKIVEVHGSNHPELIEIAKNFGKIVTDMTGHLQEEEEVLFPLIKNVESGLQNEIKPDAKIRKKIRDSLDNLSKEHDEIGTEIHTIRHLANDYEIPDDACNTFAVTYQKLHEFENDLHKHVHLENNILFHKAMQFIR